MLKELVKKTAYAVAPRWAAHIDDYLWGTKQASLLRRCCANCEQLEDVVDLLLEHDIFRAEQKRAEILGLLKLLRLEPPRRICEIGARRGGTLFLFATIASPDAQLLSLDFNYSPTQIKINRRFAVAKQQITCIQADSHNAATLETLRKWLKGELLDFLFIDGDHTFEGVENDFNMYTPLLRRGGIVAFHDIVPDFKTRFGIKTGADVGQVPAFWNNLKSQGYSTEELIEDVNQDGMGIGIVKWPGEPK